MLVTTSKFIAIGMFNYNSVSINILRLWIHRLGMGTISEIYVEMPDSFRKHFTWNNFLKITVLYK
uniref:Uncharacterized protein n=1 Tax=Monodon monoceros TaxID=40151 RepID=A0A8C6C2H2_MONMO